MKKGRAIAIAIAMVGIGIIGLRNTSAMKLLSENDVKVIKNEGDGHVYSDIEIDIDGDDNTVINGNVEELKIKDSKIEVYVFDNGKYQLTAVSNASVVQNGIQMSNIKISGYDAKANSYQYMLFGSYMQSRDDQPILWRVLTVDGNYALLLSEVILDTRPFDAVTNDWNKSSLKQWLNSSFMNEAFRESEQDVILSNGDVGKVFLLSSAELTEPSYGFSSDINSKDANRRAAGSMLAYNNNLWRVEDSSYTNYYARSKPNGKNVDLVTSKGEIKIARVERDNVGIRPAMWVDLSKLSLSGGDGTIECPYQ